MMSVDTTFKISRTYFLPYFIEFCSVMAESLQLFKTAFEVSVLAYLNHTRISYSYIKPNITITLNQKFLILT